MVGLHCIGFSPVISAPRPALPAQPCRVAARQLRSIVQHTSRRRRCAPVRAGQWPDQEVIDKALEEFPDKGVANVEEARALVSNGGYRYLDVRPKIEYDDVGKVIGSLNIPVKNGTKRWSSEKQRKVFKRTENPDFVATVEKSFPDKDEAKILIGCSDGRRYSMDALMALDEAGYSNIVGLKGGYYAWAQTFDNKGKRRVFGEYQEDYLKGGDSAGIHGSGAGFDRSDFVNAALAIPPEYNADDDDEE